MFQVIPRLGLPRGPRRLSRYLSRVAHQPLEDNFGRRHDYLRISLTERCNLRCKYCMPKEGIQLSSPSDCLSLDELKRLSSLFVETCGIKKIRLTGGEPTVDRKLMPLMEHLRDLRDAGLETISMTTNGIKLKRNVSTYKDLGLNGLNISLDTLKEDRFERLTRRKGWRLVVEGLHEAIETNLDSIKLNCVIMKGINDDEIVDFAELTLKYPIEVRFIEFMPFQGNEWSEGLMVPFRTMLDIVTERFPNLTRLNVGERSATSKTFRSSDMIGSVGFISSMSENFCSGCNRIRLTSDGNLKNCLFGRAETSLRNLIRKGATNHDLVEAITTSLKDKKKQHADAISDESSKQTSTVESPANHFTHLDAKGEAKMVNVNRKPVQRRIAVARGKIFVGDEVLSKLIRNHDSGKGDVLTVSKVAGIMGAKMTSSLIPMCHQISLDCVDIYIRICKDTSSIVVTARVEAIHKTGVEMESLTAVSTTLLCIYDMTKSMNKSMVIGDVRLVSKTKTSLE